MPANVYILPDAELSNYGHTLMAAKMYSLAACVMIFYDIALTMDQEIELIWSERLSSMSALWLLNRYLTPLGYIVIIVSFHDPSWTGERCERYIIYPEALKVATSFVIGVIFIARVYAVYSRKQVVVGFTALCLLVEISLKIWAIAGNGVRAELPAGLVGCILSGKDTTRFAFTWIAELMFDSAMFVITFWKAYSQSRTVKAGAASLIGIILRDGVIYFAVIFAANVVTVVMFLAASPDLKVFNASFSTIITSLMVSRLILNLRGVARQRKVYHVHDGIMSEVEFENADESISTTRTIDDKQQPLFVLRNDLSRMITQVA